MADANQGPLDLIAQLNSLAAKLPEGNNETARREAVRLSRQLTLCLEEPANTAVDLAFSVRLSCHSKLNQPLT
jgi:hypothetical protein